jgi:MYXO-CTERM domain-containing protein
MRSSTLRRRVLAVATALATAAAATTAVAATYNYVSWTTADVAGGTASGVISLPGDAGVTVTFTATTEDGGAGSLYGAQTGDAGTNYWVPAATYESPQVENAPPTPDLLQLSGGENETYTVNLSEPIVDPIMAIVSLGAGGTPTTYDFDSPFTIVSQGSDPWGGTSTSLVQLPNNVLQGEEGSGVIQFVGTYSKFSWTVPTPESWHGFTFGILTSAALYDGGGPDGSALVIGEDGGVIAPPDAGSAPDASAPVAEAGASPDAGSPDAAVTTSDASVAAVDGGTGGTADSGCSCRAAGVDAGWTGALGMLLGLAGLAARRRARRC